MSPSAALFLGPARTAGKAAEREVIPPDQSSLTNQVATADLSDGVRQALLSLARTIDAGHVAQDRPKPKQPWWERD